jgi:hypothetical protein
MKNAASHPGQGALTVTQRASSLQAPTFSAPLHPPVLERGG